MRGFSSLVSFVVALTISGCGSPAEPDLGAADLIGEVVAVELGFADLSSGRIVFHSTDLGCDVSALLRSGTSVRDRDGPISPLEIVSGDLAQLWTLDPPDCGVDAEAIQIVLTGIARPRDAPSE